LAAPRLLWLDVLRGIAASAVVLQHSLERSPGFYLWTERYFNLGLFGVTLFFLASGFIIPVSLGRGGLGPFWCARFFRLYPLYWVSLVGALLLSSQPIPLSQAVMNFTMLQEWFGFPHVLELYWTLSTEMFFYVLVSLLFLWPGYTQFDKRRLLLVVGAGMALLIVVMAVTGRSLPIGRYENLVALFTGVALSQHVLDPQRGRLDGRWFAGLAFLLVVAAWVRFPHPNDVQPGEAVFSWVCVLTSWGAAYGLFYAFLARGDRNYAQLALRLGSACYGMYLLHPLVMSFPGLWQSLPLLVQALGIWLLTAALALLSWRYFEWPLIRLGKALVKFGSTEKRAC